MRRAGPVTAAVLVLGWLSRGAAQKPVASSRRVVDQAGRVSFAFPAGWVREPDEFETEGADYYVPLIFTISQPGRRIRLSMNRSPWRGTEFAGLAFAEMSFPATSEPACAEALEGGRSLEREQPRTVDGVKFIHYSAGWAGMCHQAVGEVYSTFRAGRCYEFEADRYTHCGAVEETMLTYRQIRELNRRLDDLVDSIRFDGLK